MQPSKSHSGLYSISKIVFPNTVVTKTGSSRGPVESCTGPSFISRRPDGRDTVMSARTWMYRLSSRPDSG